MRRFQGQTYDLIILDLMLPGLDGPSVCHTLRLAPDYVPILMLTAKSSDLDRVLGLEVGADDYLAKPFGIPKLLARVKALLRRAEALQQHTPASDDETLHHDELTIEIGKRRGTQGGDEVALTAREFDLLLHFARHPGRVYTRSQLLDAVWGYGHDG